MGISIELTPIGRRLEAEAGQTVLQVAQSLLDPEQDGVSAPCGGKGICGRCRVRLVQGELSPPNDLEKKILGDKAIDEGYRLACQAVVIGSAKIEVPPETLSKRQKLQLEGRVISITPETSLKRVKITLRASSVDYPFSVWQQVEMYLAREMNITGLRINEDLLKQVEAIAEDGLINISLRGKEIINYSFGEKCPNPAGFAVDLGTTKIAGFLIDLATGATLASDGMLNPQIAYGEDVISRLVYAQNGEEHYNRIRDVLKEGLGRLLRQLCESVDMSPGNVEGAVFVGNTAMHHLLLGLPVRQLARSPYIPAATVPLEVKGKAMELDMAPGGVVYMIPPVAGFVGGDHVAMVLSSRIHEMPGVTLGIDIGTNTEIVLARDGELISCSCASGPAFEGAHVQQGMRAVDGAVYEVTLGEDAQRVHYKTIGDRPAIGICGSGILDAVAELYYKGVISYNGRLNNNHPRVRFNEDIKTPEFLLVPREETGTGKDLVITQKDISEIQLAKAAIASAIKVLLSLTGLKDENIDRILVAGAFGTHLNLKSAIAIGMLPALPLERYQQVGNAAAVGARMALISLKERSEAERLARVIRYVELANTKLFGDSFLRQMRFPDKPDAN